MKYVLAIDQGTTGTRAVLINEKSEFVFSDYMEHTQIYPQSGYVEHDPIEIWNNTKTVSNNVLQQAFKSGIDESDIKGIGIDNQGETVMLWDKNTGMPLYNAIVWQCRRTYDYVENLKNIPGLENKIIDKTGLIIDPYFSGTKIKWIIDNVKGVKEKIKSGEVLAGTLDSWLIWKMTGGKFFLTDVSTAARTMLFNIRDMDWDRELLDIIGVPRSILADIMPTSGDFGTTDKEAFCGVSIKITASMVDQPAALFGNGCFEPGMVKNTYGTGCFLYMNIGEELNIAGNGILTTVAWKIGNKITYAYDGGVYIAGAAIQWLRDGIGVIKNYSETDDMANSIPSTGGVYFVPAFAGIAAPYWDQYARGTMVGITGSTKKEHIVRATLESVALQVKDVVDSMNLASGKDIKMLRVDGGITKNNFTMQFQSDILDIPIEIAENPETTVLGVGYMAGLSCGVWNSIDEIRNEFTISKKYTPNMTKQKREEILLGWNQAVKRAMNWENDTRKMCAN
ncbi:MULTISPECIES: glycerol kinase GlpK [unclassified Clostridioides]|uniref:glycerol kinase GlpK n=1 Tax=unclassified Clostridioides TaxID=2635829 RepID=UPI001D0FDC21|nr:glycerol kinase GlpK [Clostridioides sp. ZZV14-6150]MCC0661440.1 glycerol kinase GlpK [Clostridioides sp. ZZV14-6154]MCC0721980.1 glycerol kinase GlpK [Clostridioides sp. ZZV14-6104]MCC0731830.1 glycerol kinase GlpK [Clostridioides sp. ZZV14-6048]MCC0738938.1 glycerol kinase GlpK [Clostridioides sp. ZZV14-5902]MCC0743788.1 glycerol kinase GlpK [Clostridioides sp. ZZV14-6044]MCC0750695.1 glycerol kinase GlpK [Clostridioides sp. ZZV13-5731]WLD27034.1 Glycerol kinase [Clostridioides difficil